MKRSTIFSAAILLGFAVERLAAETVHLSRYALRLPSEGNSVFIQGVPLPVLYEYCRDLDGCKVGLKVEDEVGLSTKSTRFYIGEADALQWSSEGSQIAGMHRDDDNEADDVLTVAGPSSTTRWSWMQ